MRFNRNMGLSSGWNKRGTGPFSLGRQKEQKGSGLFVLSGGKGGENWIQSKWHCRAGFGGGWHWRKPFPIGMPVQALAKPVAHTFRTEIMSRDFRSLHSRVHSRVIVDWNPSQPLQQMTPSLPLDRATRRGCIPGGCRRVVGPQLIEELIHAYRCDDVDAPLDGHGLVASAAVCASYGRPSLYRTV